MHKNLNEFEFLPDPTTDWSYLPLSTRKINILSCGHAIPFIFDWIFFIFAGNKDNHKVAEEFEITPDPTMELAALERLENCHRLLMGEIL